MTEQEDRVTEPAPEISAAMTERDIYKGLYEDILTRLLAKA